ncbi:hypothetical protein HPB49_026340 [Dermacentor silvarum]|nr:hypothetical protein HPB49_026340 [Dermacentor silvarum]
MRHVATVACSPCYLESYASMGCECRLPIPYQVTADISAARGPNNDRSLGLELQLRYDAQARAAEIVDQWIAKHAAATQCQSGTTDTAADAPAPTGEVGDDLPAATQSPAALQPSDTVEPTMVELPVTSDEKEMDETTTRKRGRDSEDEEELPKQSKGPGAHSDSKRKPLTPPSTPAATEPVPAAATSTEGPADTSAAAEKTSPSAAPGKPATTTPGVAASQKTADSHQPEPRRKAPPQTAADFLKRNQRPATNVATKKQLKKTVKGKHSQPAGAPQAPSMVRAAAMHTTHHPDWTMECVAALCDEPFQLHELTKALDRSRRRSAPGADGITFQMLRNLADAEKARLLDCLNAVWNNGQLPESWLTAIVSSPQPVTAGVPQGSVLSPFLFNVALARLPSSIPKGRRFPVHCSVYADDIALWTSGPRRSLPAVRTCLQEALDASVGHLASVGLTVSSAKTKALLVHPRSATRRSTACLSVGGTEIPWQKTGHPARDEDDCPLPSTLLPLFPFFSPPFPSPPMLSRA